nr:U-box domain-containing protein 4 [Ipomoea batatas]
MLFSFHILCNNVIPVPLDTGGWRQITPSLWSRVRNRLALIDKNKLSIGACGAIPPLVALLINGSNRGKKDSLKLCSVKLNKERAVKPPVELVGVNDEKAMVVLNSLAAIEIGRDAIVEEGGIAALVEAIEDSSDNGEICGAHASAIVLVSVCGKWENILNKKLGLYPFSSIFSTSSNYSPLVSANWVSNLVVSLTFLTLIEAIGTSGTFLLFAGCSLIGLVTIFFLVLETKGLQFEEVEKMLEKGYKPTQLVV